MSNKTGLHQYLKRRLPSRFMMLALAGALRLFVLFLANLFIPLSSTLLQHQQLPDKTIWYTDLNQEDYLKGLSLG
jgi:hypothetical protein